MDQFRALLDCKDDLFLVHSMRALPLLQENEALASAFNNKSISSFAAQWVARLENFSSQPATQQTRCDILALLKITIEQSPQWLLKQNLEVLVLFTRKLFLFFFINQQLLFLGLGKVIAFYCTLLTTSLEISLFHLD